MYNKLMWRRRGVPIYNVILLNIIIILHILVSNSIWIVNTKKRVVKKITLKIQNFLWELDVIIERNTSFNA